MGEDRKVEEGGPGDGLTSLFAFFNEVGIISQLSGAVLQSRLPDGLTVPHFSVLNHLIRVRDGQTPLRLANAFQVPKTTMTHTLAGLESRGLVEARPNPEDGRSKCIWITPAGRDFRDRAIQSLAGDFARLGAEIDLAEVQRLTPALARIRQVLDAARE